MILTVTNDHNMQVALGRIREAFKRDGGYLRITVREGKDRTHLQNALSHAWYEQLARELPEDTAEGWKCFCKLHCGVPILRRDDEDFRASYDASLKAMTYESKLKAMRILPVTSLMTTRQLGEYLEEVKALFLARGVLLEFPEEMRGAA